MRRFARSKIGILFASALCVALICYSTPLAAATVAGTSSHTISFTQTPSTGFLSGVNLPITSSLRTVFRTSGVSADQVDGIFAKTITFVASTPQSIDLTNITDVLGNTITAARVRFISVKVKWTTDAKPLTIGNSGANDWLGICGSATSTVLVYPSSTTNDGYTIWAMPQTTGAATIDGTHKIIKLDPGTAAGDVELIIATCSS